MISFSLFLFFHNIKKLSLLKYINHFLFFILAFSFLIISCSSTKRFPRNEAEENISKNVNLDFSSVRVLLEESKEIYYLTMQSPVYLYDQSDRLAYIEAGNTIECKNDYNSVKLVVQNREFSANAFFLRNVENNNAVSFNGKGYKGEIILRHFGKSIGIINSLQIEDYVKGVVAKEMPVGKNSENFEALKAFAICVRTYALKKITEGKSIFDLYDDSRDQVYGGLSAEHHLSNLAVQDTENKILVHDNEIASIFYHSTCGGFTEAAHNVFSSKEIPYMMGIKDGSSPYCKISSKFEWTESYSENAIVKMLIKHSFLENDNYTLKNIVVESRFPSGRVNELVFEFEDDSGMEKNISIFGNRIRSVIRTADNKNILWSTKFDVWFSRNHIRISGNGFGHGAGLCQYGAVSLSHKGWDFRDIIEHYFPGIEIKNIND